MVDHMKLYVWESVFLYFIRFIERIFIYEGYFTSQHLIRDIIMASKHL